MAAPYHGSCFCGAVQISVSGEPVAMGYCHCRSCRAWSGAPVFAYALWTPDVVAVAKGAEDLAGFNRTQATTRRFCRRCGGHVMAEFQGLVDVGAGILPDLPFVPSMHVNYAEAVLPMKDGPPKFRDFPAEAGGSGEQVPE